ncbi:MAG: sulfotransferase [Nitrospinota bacterium]
MSVITVIGRGHSGTRAISQTLYASGVFMGNMINNSGDKLPQDSLYKACRVFGKYVHWRGGLSWDFETLHSMEMDHDFTRYLSDYLSDVIESKSIQKGWKIPETTLILPWLVRLLPEVKYIYIVRDPRDTIIGSNHPTDELNNFCVTYPETKDSALRRAISWKYQYDIVSATPKPENWIKIRYEDFVLKQDHVLHELEEFLGIPLAKIIVKKDSIGKWKQRPDLPDFDFLQPALSENGYQVL